MAPLVSLTSRYKPIFATRVNVIIVICTISRSHPLGGSISVRHWETAAGLRRIESGKMDGKRFVEILLMTLSKVMVPKICQHSNSIILKRNI